MCRLVALSWYLSVGLTTGAWSFPPAGRRLESVDARQCDGGETHEVVGHGVGLVLRLVKLSLCFF